MTLDHIVIVVTVLTSCKYVFTVAEARNHVDDVHVYTCPVNMVP
jgi:hypothetical protein